MNDRLVCDISMSTVQKCLNTQANDLCMKKERYISANNYENKVDKTTAIIYKL